MWEKEGKDKPVSGPLYLFTSKTYFILNCPFFSSTEKAQRRDFSNGQADRIHE